MSLKRTPLPDDRTGQTRRFSLPYKRDDGLPDDIREGLKHLKVLGERALTEPASDQTKQQLHATLNWIANLIAQQPQPGDRMKFYFTVGLYPDGRLGEVFIKADRSGSLASGALDAVAMVMSIALQHGVPLQVLLDKIRHLRFEPEGWTGNEEFPRASSVLDLLAQWLSKKFLPTTTEIK